MSYKKASPNFYYYEFAPSGTTKSWVPDTQLLDVLIVEMAANLQILRDNLPTGTGIRITSAVRTAEDFKRLVCMGYHPSATSDHNYGVPVPTASQSASRKKYGPLYTLSVGACDCIPTANITARQMFEKAVELNSNLVTRFGQVIYEKNPSNGSEWVHLGNNPAVLLSGSMAKFMGRQPYLISVDGGKSYSKYL